MQAAILASVKDVVSLDREDPSKEQKILDVRTETNNWVARYRRDNSFAGRPSYRYGKFVEDHCLCVFGTFSPYLLFSSVSLPWQNLGSKTYF